MQKARATRADRFQLKSRAPMHVPEAVGLKLFAGFKDRGHIYPGSPPVLSVEPFEQIGASALNERFSPSRVPLRNSR